MVAHPAPVVSLGRHQWPPRQHFQHGREPVGAPVAHGGQQHVPGAGDARGRRDAAPAHEAGQAAQAKFVASIAHANADAARAAGRPWGRARGPGSRRACWPGGHPRSGPVFRWRSRRAGESGPADARWPLRPAGHHAASISSISPRSRPRASMTGRVMGSTTVTTCQLSARRARPTAAAPGGAIRLGDALDREAL